MRFAGGAVGVGSPTVCSSPVMALPCFVLFLCHFERAEIERKRCPLVVSSTLIIFFLLVSCTECSENRTSCTVSLLQWLIMESQAINITDTL